MNIIALDDEVLALKGIVNKIKMLCPEDQVLGFCDVKEAFSYAGENKVDVAFLDIEMAEINGIETAKKLRECNSKINIIFTTGYKEYMGEAFSLFASGYILKPVTEKKVKEQLDNLRFPVSAQEEFRVVVKTFGPFEVFVDNSPLKFKYAKTKELLAILVDRAGKYCTSGDIINILWDDEEDFTDHSSYLRNLQVDLVTVFKEKGLADIIIKQRGSIAVDMNKISCDFIDFYKGLMTDNSGPAFHGEYMSQYSWAECRIPMFEEARPW